jgi:hypothetical protein
MSKAHFFDLEKEWPTFIAHLRRGCVTPRVPFMAPDLPPNFIQRPREFDALKNLLLTPDRAQPVAITTALSGAGGFGKTTLAAALCHDENVVANFNDGIMWTTLGQTPGRRSYSEQVNAQGPRFGFDLKPSALRAPRRYPAKPSRKPPGWFGPLRHRREFGKRISVLAPRFTHAQAHPNLKRSRLQDKLSKRQAHSECVVRANAKPQKVRCGCSRL